MNDLEHVTPGAQQRALWLSTFAFTICFAVWMIFSIIGNNLPSTAAAKRLGRYGFGLDQVGTDDGLERLTP